MRPLSLSRVLRCIRTTVQLRKISYPTSRSYFLPPSRRFTNEVQIEINTFVQRLEIHPAREAGEDSNFGPCSSGQKPLANFRLKSSYCRPPTPPDWGANIT